MSPAVVALRAREAWWRRRVQLRRREERRAHERGSHDQAQAARAVRRRAEAALSKVRGQLRARRNPMRLRALDAARELVGVMEVGGNNAGPKVSAIIRANGGVGPEPWCGDFVAFCYRKAGSKMVTRPWAAVRLLGWLTGMKLLDGPQPGAIVIYTFDHTGLVEKVLPGGRIQTIEGNTGPTGAVSDSTTGGDGVYRKVRPRSLVRRYVLPTR